MVARSRRGRQPELPPRMDSARLCRYRRGGDWVFDNQKFERAAALLLEHGAQLSPISAAAPGTRHDGLFLRDETRSQQQSRRGAFDCRRRRLLSVIWIAISRVWTFQSGRTLWKTHLGTSVQGFPVSFAISGKQYIAVPTGLGGGSRAMCREWSRPKIHHSGNGNAIYSFALPV